MLRTFLATIVILQSSVALMAEVSQTNSFNNVNLLIPDGTTTGVQDIRTISSPIVELTSVKVRLKLSGNFNGDLYGYVRHVSGPMTHISILLNRPGRTLQQPFGYGDDGFDVTFSDDAANDIHTYHLVTVPAAGVPLVGEWQPDARFVDPVGVTSDSSRSAFLSVFDGLNASGMWTLFLADIDSGGTSFLQSWGLELAGKVSPSITWPVPATMTYGMALGTAQLNATADVPGTFTYTPSAGTVLNAGQSRILSVTFVPDDTQQYVIAQATVAVDVDPAPLEARVTNQARLYGETNPVFTIKYTGFVNGEDLSIVTGSHLGTTTAGTNSPVGTYVIHAPNSTAPNYTVDSVDGILSVEPAPLLVAADNARKAQNEPNPAFTATISGLVNGDGTNILNGILSLTTTADQDSPVGTYPIIPSGLTATNYSVEFTNGTLTVTPYALVVTADDVSRLYGATNAVLNGTVVGLQEGDNITVSYSTTATETSPVGTYSIVPELHDPEGKLTNYSVTIHEGTLSVERAPLIAKLANLTRLYGETNPVFPIIYVGFVAGDGPDIVTGATTGSTIAKTNSPVGIYSISLPELSATNYSITYLDGTLTIEPAVLLVTAQNFGRAFGEPNPAFTATISGFVNGENANVLEGNLLLTTPADETSPPGVYSISPSGLTSTNYAIQFVDGVLTITLYSLVITTDNAVRTYGAENPALMGHIVGLHQGDHITVSCSTSATNGSAVGIYTIVPALDDPDGQLTNYTVTMTGGLLTIQPAELHVQALNAVREYGQPNPDFAALISGFVNGENTNVFQGTLVLNTAAGADSLVGDYSIVASGLIATNYSIQYSNGTLTVIKAQSIGGLLSSKNPALPGSSITFTASIDPHPPGGGQPSGTVVLQVDGENYGSPMSLVNRKAQFSSGALSWGLHTISFQYSGDDNFLEISNVLSPPQIINTPPVTGNHILQRSPAQGTKIPVTDLIAGDSDADGESIALDSAMVTSSAGGTVKVASGWILYVPPPGYTNTDSFGYTIRDSLGGIGVGTVVVNVRTNASAPSLKISKLGNQGCRLSISGPPWATYSLESTHDLRTHNWQLVDMKVADVVGRLDFDDTILPGSQFYRALYRQDLDAFLPAEFQVTSSANPSPPGSTVIFTANLTALIEGTGPPAGTVQFKVDGAQYGPLMVLVNGSASLSTDSLPWGVHTVSAMYQGDGTFANQTNGLSSLQVIDTPPVAAPYAIERSPTSGTKVPVADLLAVDSDADGEAISFEAVGPKSAEGGTLGITNGWIYYTPPTGPVNADSFTYTIHDSLGVSAIGTVAVTTPVGNEPSPNVTVLDGGGGTYRVLFSGIPWRTYTIQYAENLASPSWNILGERTADSQGQFEYDDALADGTPPRYYRAVSQGNAPTASPFRVAVWTNFITQTNGRTMDMWSVRSYPPEWPNSPPELAWNTSCLLYGHDGFTAISQCNEFEGAPGQVPVTLLTRRHAFLRGHGLGSNGLQTNGLAGKRVWFCAADNTVVQMTIAAHFIRVGSFSGRFYDHGVVIFTSDVPNSIAPISVMSTESFEIYYYSTTEIPFLTLGTEQDGHCATGGTAIPPFIYPLFKGGDSGSPNILPSPDNKLIMFSGRGVPGFSSQVQADVDTLSMYSGLNTNNYRLRWYDLSPWAP